MNAATPIDYDAIAGMYALNRSASEAVVGHVLAALRGEPPREVLEIGCGTADHLYALSEEWGASGQGFDRSPAMVEQGLKKYPGLCLRMGDASEAFPYPDAGFDFAFSVNVIHYISALERYFGEAFRILKPGGIVLTVTDSEQDIRRRATSYYFPETVAVELARYPSIDSIEAAMRKAGFARIWISHTERLLRLDEGHLERYRQKAFSCLRLISEAGYREGLRRLEEDVQSGKAVGREVYTYVWGCKG